MSYGITDAEFKRLSGLLHDRTGIAMSDAKKMLVIGRLSKRLAALGLDTFTQYHRYVTDAAHADEMQFMVDLLTTNETYFFREPQHFDFLRQEILPAVGPGHAFRAWSAAASVGAEAYTIAMVLADRFGLGGPWDILGTDINGAVLEQARRGHYAMAEAAKIPMDCLKKYCLKGKGPQAGTFLIDPRLRQHVVFEQMNLNAGSPRKVGDFDVIFLRNVLIYFDLPTKRRVIGNLVPSLKRGGYLIVGHAESLNGITDAVTQVKPTIYRRP